MKLKNYLAIAIILSFVHGVANADIIKTINFESETIGVLPSTSSTDTSKVKGINFGDPLIKANGTNKYLEFDQSNNDRSIQNQLYDQIQVGTYAYEPVARFTFDMFLGTTDATAVLFFDNPTIQRFDFMGNGTIKAHNVDPSSSSVYDNIFDVSSYDFTEWHNYIFDINYDTDLVDVYIDNALAFSSTIFSQSGGTNSVRLSTVSNTSFGVDNLLLETNPAALQTSVPEASSIYLLAFGLIGLFGAARRKV